jgi:hypothetical protein
MNGRIYDPLLGRFLSADILVQNPSSLQSFNRYSYIANNPLSGTDPTGFADTFQQWMEKHKDDPNVKAINASMAANGQNKLTVDPAKATATLSTVSADQANPSGASQQQAKINDQGVKANNDGALNAGSSVASQTSAATSNGGTGVGGVPGGGTAGDPYRGMPTGHLSPNVVGAVANSIDSLNGGWIDNLVKDFGKEEVLDFLNDAIPQCQDIVNAHLQAIGQLTDASSYAALGHLVNEIMSPRTVYRFDKNGKPEGVGGTSFDPKENLISINRWHLNSKTDYGKMSEYFLNISVYRHEYTHYQDKQNAILNGQQFRLQTATFKGLSEAHAYNSQVQMLQQALNHLKSE